jgi:hypothetical protein
MSLSNTPPTSPPKKMKEGRKRKSYRQNTTQAAFNIIQGDSYRTSPINLLIIPQVMHITPHNYDIIIRGPC